MPETHTCIGSITRQSRPSTFSGVQSTSILVSLTGVSGDRLDLARLLETVEHDCGVSREQPGFRGVNSVRPILADAQLVRPRGSGPCRAHPVFDPEGLLRSAPG